MEVKQKISIFFFISIFAANILLIQSCKKDNTEYSVLKGEWVEITKESDTLVFKENEPEGRFELNRGKEMSNNGYLLPLPASGLYDYSITEDSISLYWMLSSSSYYHNYYFNLDQEKEQIRIGNFFGDTLDYDEILIFEKI